MADKKIAFIQFTDKGIILDPPNMEKIPIECIDKIGSILWFIEIIKDIEEWQPEPSATQDKPIYVYV